jgi:hypothetical protein
VVFLRYSIRLSSFLYGSSAEVTLEPTQAHIPSITLQATLFTLLRSVKHGRVYAMHVYIDSYARIYSMPAFTLCTHLLYARTYSAPALIHILPVSHSTAIPNKLSKLSTHPLPASLRPRPDPSSVLPDYPHALSFRRPVIVLVNFSTVLRDQNDRHSHFPCALAQNPPSQLLGFAARDARTSLDILAERQADRVPLLRQR